MLAARSQRPNVLIIEGWETLGAAKVVGSQGVDPLRERFVKIFDDYFAGHGTALYTVYALDVIEFIADLCQAAQEAVPATGTPPAPPIALTIANESMTPPRVFSIIVDSCLFFLFCQVDLCQFLVFKFWTICSTGSYFNSNILFILNVY